MATLSEHLIRVLSQIERTSPQRISLKEAVGNVLATDIPAQLPVPLFSNSAMDGFLVNNSDLSDTGPWILPVSGDIAAGEKAFSVTRGTAVRVMTGAPIGDPIDPSLVVIPLEQTDYPANTLDLPAEVKIFNFDKQTTNIRLLGENIKVGDIVASQGDLIDAGLLAALISTGVNTVEVYSNPKITLLSTGNELVDVSEKITPGKIPNSNGPMLAELIRSKGIKTIHQMHTEDNQSEFKQKFLTALDNSDIVITIGGVSTGSFDIVKQTVGRLPHMWFGSVSIQPGKPQGVGTCTRSDGTKVSVICLPGNPVAAFVSFHLFVAPALKKAKGMQVDSRLSSRPHIIATAAAAFPKSKDRDLIVPVRLDWLVSGVVAVPFTSSGIGSHFAASLNKIAGLVIIPKGDPKIKTGMTLKVYLT